MNEDSRWSFIKEQGKDKHRKSLGLYQCSCGTLKVLRITVVDNKYSRSCGCLSRDVSRKLHTTHGKSYDRVYSVYRNMLLRCNDTNNSAYPNYGGRGIKVCDRWLESFENFLSDMEEGYKDDLTLERVDPNKGYIKENCTWVTRGEQNRNNTRRRDNKTGVVGVHFSEAKNSYICQWNDENGKRKSKTFSIKRLGEIEAFNMAVSYREDIIYSLQGKGIYYSPFHGDEKYENKYGKIK